MVQIVAGKHALGIISDWKVTTETCNHKFDFASLRAKYIFFPWLHIGKRGKLSPYVRPILLARLLGETKEKWHLELSICYDFVFQDTLITTVQSNSRYGMAVCTCFYSIC